MSVPIYTFPASGGGGIAPGSDADLGNVTADGYSNLGNPVNAVSTNTVLTTAQTTGTLFVDAGALGNTVQITMPLSPDNANQLRIVNVGTGGTVSVIPSGAENIAGQGSGEPQLIEIPNKAFQLQASTGGYRIVQDSRFSFDTYILGFPGVPADSAISYIAVLRDCRFKVGAAFAAYCQVVPTAASVSLDIIRDVPGGSQTVIGDVTFTSGSNEGTVTIDADVDFDAGDLLVLENLGTADATLADLQISIRALNI